MERCVRLGAPVGLVRFIATEKIKLPMAANDGLLDRTYQR
jgi:hypothetical protein